MNELHEEEIILYSEEDIKSNSELIQKSKRKRIVFVVFTSLILIFSILSFSNPLFLFSLSKTQEDVSATTAFFNLVSYFFILFTFLYILFFLVYFNGRLKQTEEEQLASLKRFRFHYNLFDLLGVVPVFLAVLTFVNGFFFGFATVVGPSMEPTFCPDDYVVIEQFTMNFQPEDIMIFIHEDTKLIKRVVGVAGDHLVVNESGVYINDVQIETFFPAGFIPTDMTIPENYFYVLGDNRHNSNDSRSFGLVYIDNVLGEVVMKINNDGC